MGSDGWLYIYDRERFHEILSECLGDKFNDDFVKQMEFFSLTLGNVRVIVRYAEYGTDHAELDWLFVALENAGLSCDYQGEGWKVIERLDGEVLVRQNLWT